MKLYEDKFITITLDKANKMILMKWFPSTQMAIERDFKAWNQQLVKLVEEYQPSCMLADTQEYYFTINEEMQAWAKINVFEAFAQAGVRKLALVMSEEFIAQMSLEQFVEEYKGGAITSAYFQKSEEAWEWLTQNAVEKVQGT